MGTVSSRQPLRPVNLLRWFSLTALVSVALVSGLAALIFSSFLTERMIRQEAELTAGFVRSIVASENAYHYFSGTRGATDQQLQRFLDNINRIPGVLRTNVYSADRRVVWSSDRTLIGQQFDRNDELDEALRADLVIHSGIIDPAHLAKSEHQHLAEAGNRFIESYVPIFDVHGRQVVGAVELYKVPLDLFEAIHTGTLMIWLASALAGAFLYGALFWIANRADRVIQLQGRQLVETESLAAIGDMGATVAQGLSAPLGAIRGAALHTLETALSPLARKRTIDIVSQVERLEGWARQLERYARAAQARLSAVDLNGAIEASLGQHGHDLARRGITVHRSLAAALPPVWGNPEILLQVLGSLLDHALATLPAGGEIAVRSGRDAKGLVFVDIRHPGPTAARAPSATATADPAATGLGLPVIRKLIERLGGSVDIDPANGEQSAVRLSLPLVP